MKNHYDNGSDGDDNDDDEDDAYKDDDNYGKGYTN